MDDPTSLLFGLDTFTVTRVSRVAGGVQVVIETRAREAACPDCGVLTSRVKDRPLVRIRDLPSSGQQVELWWRKRRLYCGEIVCLRRSFTETTTLIPPRSRLTVRLREHLATAIAVSNRAVSEVGHEYGVSWHTAHRALIAAAVRCLPEPAPTRVLGIDETRARRVRWVLQDAGWRRSDPWMTSFVAADPDGPGALLGLVPGRSGTCVSDWLKLQSPQFRAGIELVVIDPSAPYASGIRRSLPQARIAVDKWHLIKLANDTVTQVRQRVTREQTGHRGRRDNPVWAHRRMLLTGAERLSTRQWARLKATLRAGDPTDEIGAAWAVKERLRLLLNEHDPHRIRHRLWQFYDAAARADTEETTRLASTIETWWPAILIALREDVTNARTEGFNRVIKQIKRVACGFTNMDNYRRRIMVHIALTRARRDAA